MKSINEVAVDWWAERWQDAPSKFEFMCVMIEMLPHGDWLTYSDYDPQDLLLKIVQRVKPDCRGCAFSSDGLLPYKTGLKRKDNRLYAHEGYGSGWVEIPLPSPTPPSPDTDSSSASACSATSSG